MKKLTVVLFAACVCASAANITGKVAAGKGPSVVYVDAIAGKTFPAPTKSYVMDQKQLLFAPHILAVQAGTTVEFLNSDKVAHNIFWPSVSGNKKLTHNMGTWPSGEKRAWKFDAPGIVPLLCNVHPEMSGFIVVAPTPYFAETDAEGNFKIADVPAGSYTVIAWHEGSKTQSKPVTVGGDVSVEFTLSK
ncbi:MAG: carboxypeptidase regulatory-like domain-containing protein [Bryobacteraceae bacterium]|jgi:plastocyanin